MKKPLPFFIPMNLNKKYEVGFNNGLIETDEYYKSSLRPLIACCDDMSDLQFGNAVDRLRQISDRLKEIIK